MTVRTEFEPEEMRPPRRHGRTTLLVALCMVGASAGGLWAAWRVTGHHGGDAGVPIIRADDRPVKVPPANPGGMEVPDQNIAMSSTARGRPIRASSSFCRRPRRRCRVPRRPSRPCRGRRPPAAARRAVPLPPTAAPPPAPAASPAQPAVAAARLPPAAVMPRRRPPRRNGAGAGGYRLQVAAVRSPDAAQQEWARLKRVNADVLGKLDMRTARADLGERGTYYRIEAGPIADAAAAQRACDALKQRKVGCILVKP